MKYIGRLLVYFLGFICVIPVLFVVTGTLMGNTELASVLAPVLAEERGYAGWHLIPSWPTLKNLIALLLDTPEYYVLFWNSIKVVTAILVGQFVFAVPAAWGMAQSRRKWSGIAFSVYIFCMLLPFQVTMLSQYLVLNSLSLIDTHLSLILPLVFSTFPVFIVYQSFLDIPPTVLEAAKIDGAGHFQIFCHIGVPIALQGILAAMVVGFLEYWNMVEQPVVFLQEKKLWTLSVYIPELTVENAGNAFAFSLFSLLPAVVIFIVGKEFLAQGIAIQGTGLEDK